MQEYQVVRLGNKNYSAKTLTESSQPAIVFTALCLYGGGQ